MYAHGKNARDLPLKDITGNLDPYVEVKMGNNAPNIFPHAYTTKISPKASFLATSSLVS